MSERRRRILIVDDQRIIAADLEQTLARLGYSVVGVASAGEEAVRKAGELGPELILMDIRLRGDMDGIEAAGIIRERLDVPVVYLTAYADEETILRAKVTTPFGYVVKPFNERELRAAIEIALYKHETGRSLAEERARRRVAEESGLLIESVKDYAIFRLDPNGRVVSWNAGAERIQAYRADEVAGNHVSMFFPPEQVDAGTPEQVLTHAKRTGHAEHEGWWVRKDGVRCWASVTITALRIDEDLVGFSAIVRDLSERRAYTRALRESEKRFRTAVIHAPVPMMLHAEDGEVLAVSEAVIEATGYRREQLRRSDDWIDLAYGERAADVRAFVEDAFNGDAPSPTELTVRLASGETRQWLFSVSEPLMLGGGRRGIVAVAVDVTKQRRAEEALQESHRQKDEFIAMLGHELRNPLAAVRSATELLKLTSNHDPKYQRVEDVLERQTVHMAKLIDGLLDVSRFVSGRISLERDILDLHDVLEESIADRGSQLQRRGLELSVDIEDGAFWVCGDRIRLAQVFDNLLANAIKFTPSPGHIFVSARRGGDEAIVTVRDTGVGIDAELLPYIFEPFRQAEQSLGRAAGGLGLGLAIVKGVVELHGGSVVARNRDDRGAELTVHLPLASGPDEGPAKERDAGRRARVLIVEDNVDAADTLRAVLETLGHEVEVAYDAESALDVMRAFQADVVLCDIGLPGGMNGYDLARTLRAKGDKTPMVAVTGYGRPEDVRQAYAAGFDAHLVKPIAVAAIEDLMPKPLTP